MLTCSRDPDTQRTAALGCDGDPEDGEEPSQLPPLKPVTKIPSRLATSTAGRQGKPNPNSRAWNSPANPFFNSKQAANHKGKILSLPLISSNDGQENPTKTDQQINWSLLKYDRFLTVSLSGSHSSKAITEPDGGFHSSTRK